MQGSPKGSKGPLSMRVLEDEGHQVIGAWAEKVPRACPLWGGVDTCHGHPQGTPGQFTSTPDLCPQGEPVPGLFPVPSHHPAPHLVLGFLPPGGDWGASDGHWADRLAAGGSGGGGVDP